jgi:hypothetical protein
MVQVDLPGAFAAGQIFAVLTKKYLKKEETLFTHRLMGPITTYFALMFVPAGLFLLICWPSWECMYWWEWVEKAAMNPPVSFFYLGFYMILILIGMASYEFAHYLYLRGKDRVVNLLTFAGVILTLLPFILWPFTWYHVGTYADYHAVPRTTTTLFNMKPFFFSWLAIMLYFTISSVIFALWIKKYAATLPPAADTGRQ